MSNTPATRRIAEFAVSTRWSDLPPEVVDKAAQHIHDTWAAMHAGADQPWTDATRRHALREGAPGPCRLVGHATRRTATMAALVNATAAHGLELDDYHVPAAVHAGCVVVPVGVAVAEELDADGQDTLTAIAVGYEIVIRLGLALSPEMTQDRGFHVTSIMGPVGAAAVAANLRKLSPDQTISALGIAAAQAGGTTEFTRSGGEVKRLHAGFAAAAGVRAADLAHLGVTGPAHAIEGPRGLTQAVAGRRQDLEHLTDQLGTRWHLDGLGAKAWATCTGNHAPIAALAKLCDEGVTADQVERLDVYTDRTTAEHCGHVGPVVTDLTGAQFSLHVTMGMRLALGGNDPEHYRQLGQLGWYHPLVDHVARAVRIHVDDAHERAFRSNPTATVVVRLRDGRQLEATASPPGGPWAPFDWDQLTAKLSRCSAAPPHSEEAAAIAAAARAWTQPGTRVRGTTWRTTGAAGSPPHEG